MKKIGILLLTALSLNLHAAYDPCLLDMRFNDVSYLISHNSASYKPSQSYKGQFVNSQNQDVSPKEQIEREGVRGFKMGLFYSDKAKQAGKVLACHGFRSGDVKSTAEKLAKKIPFKPVEKAVVKTVERVEKEIPSCVFDPAAQPLENILRDVATFLKNNKNEVFTLFLEERPIRNNDLMSVFKKTGLDTMMHKQNIALPWPTLKEMIKNNKRLVVFTSKLPDSNLPFNHSNPFVYSTHYEFKKPKDLYLKEGKNVTRIKDEKSPSFLNRDKTPQNKIYVMQHFVTKDTSGDAGYAGKVNRYDVVMPRANALRYKTGKYPTYVWVDFVEKGDRGVAKAVLKMNEFICLPKEPVKKLPAISPKRPVAPGTIKPTAKKPPFIQRRGTIKT